MCVCVCVCTIERLRWVLRISISLWMFHISGDIKGEHHFPALKRLTLTPHRRREADGEENVIQSYLNCAVISAKLSGLCLSFNTQSGCFVIVLQLLAALVWFCAPVNKRGCPSATVDTALERGSLQDRRTTHWGKTRKFIVPFHPLFLLLVCWLILVYH